jgi:hypothetical protein
MELFRIFGIIWFLWRHVEIYFLIFENCEDCGILWIFGIIWFLLRLVEDLLFGF